MALCGIYYWDLSDLFLGLVGSVGSIIPYRRGRSLGDEEGLSCKECLLREGEDVFALLSTPCSSVPFHQSMGSS